MPKIQWYPGHIAKVERELANHLKFADVVIAVVDARMPRATFNPRLQQQIAHKPLLMLLNKTDLADPQITKEWIRHLEAIGDKVKVMPYDVKSGRNNQPLINALIKMGSEALAKQVAKGLKRRPVRVLIVGMPNVGKSSLINHIVHKKKVKTGHKAGVTRHPQWVRIHPEVELLDTPGIIPPSLDSDDIGCLLAVVHSIGEATFEEEDIAEFLLDWVASRYPGQIRAHYQVPDSEPVTLATCAISRKFLVDGARPDTLRMGQVLLSDFRQGRLGRLSLERPDESRWSRTDDANQDEACPEDAGDPTGTPEPPAGV